MRIKKCAGGEKSAKKKCGNFFLGGVRTNFLRDKIIWVRKILASGIYRGCEKMRRMDFFPSNLAKITNGGTY